MKTPLPYLLLPLLISFGKLPAASVWIEGEAATSTNTKKHPWYGGEVKKDLLSGGDFVSHFDGKKPAEIIFKFDAPEAGNYTFWIRVNPVGAKLSVEINGGDKQEVSLKGAKGSTNIAKDGKPDLRFIAWVDAGKVPLKKGANTVKFFFESKNNYHGALDCFVFTNDGFTPRRTVRPEQAAADKKRRAENNKGWTPWEPEKDAFTDSAIDLRFLNEKFAGEHGNIIAKGEKLVRSSDGEEIRFWAVNGPSGELDGKDLAECARSLAKHGVNMVRIHGAVFDGKTGEVSKEKIDRISDTVAAMKKEGIYSHLSIYFPLWLKPTDGPGWSVKPRFFVQPWTLMAPTQMGQFPAAALIFRKRLVSEGELAANITLSLEDAFALKGAKLNNKANLDALREADVKGDSGSTTGGIDALIHYVGRTNISIDQPDAKESLADLSKFIDRKNQTVTSNTSELKLDYGKGILFINAPAAQGVSGNFKGQGKIQLADISIESDMELGEIIAVSLDGSPLAAAKKILLQVMTEEKPTGFETEDAGNGLKRITNLGTDPWLFKEPSGTIRLKGKVKTTALDLNGYPVKQMGAGEEIRLDPKTVYYLLER